MSRTNLKNLVIRNVMIAVLAAALSACGGGGGGGSAVSTGSATVSGSVGDGPIVGGTVTIKDRNGDIIITTTSDASANYNVTVEISSDRYPLIIEATGGTDLVTGRAPDFMLSSILFQQNTGGQTTLNINPFTTLIYQTAAAMPGGASEQNVNSARQYVFDAVGFGLDPNIITDPSTTPVSDANVAMIVKASEALGEMIRRTSDIIRAQDASVDIEDVITALAADLTDGIIDGQGAAGTQARISATATVVSAQVLIESLGDNLKVDGSNATASLNNAIVSTHPAATVTTVPNNAAALTQARTAVGAASAIAPSTALSIIASVLESIPPGASPGAVNAVLPADSSSDLDNAINIISVATSSQINAVNEAVRDASNNPPPPETAPEPGSLAITGTAPAAYIWGTITSGAVVYTDRDFTFSSIPARYAGMQYLRTANDDKSKTGNNLVSFNVNQAVSIYIGLDTFVNPVPGWLNSWTDTGDQIAAQTAFRVYRKNFAAGTVTLGGNEGDGSSSMYFVMVGNQDGSVPTPPPAQAPTLSFSASTNSVAYNSSATLSWTSSNATLCSASGGWSGNNKGTSGITSVGPLTANVSYTLTCSGDGGQVTRSVSISVGAPPVQTPTVSLSASPSSVNTNAATTLSWSTSNVDSCTASGGWSDGKTTSGSTSSGALTSNTTFTLTCSGTGGTASQSVTVSVSALPPPPAPSVTLSASPSLVGFNKPTTLSWTVSNADSCTASGGWSGSKSPAGNSQSSGALTIDTTFTLSCSGAGGSASDSVTVAVQPVTGSATLTWTPPTTNEDGSVLTDLAGYKIRYRTSSESRYPDTNTIVVSNPGIASYVVDDLPAGTHYFVVTAFDTSGNESIFSNEGSKIIN